jgi:predicted small integral membrane protein
MAFFLLFDRMAIRLCKIALVACSGFFLLLVVFNNLTDYGSNFGFVQHVLSMDTTFPGNRGLWRATTSPVAHHLFYATVILWETVACGLIGFGAWRLWQARKLPLAAWQRAKSLAVVGLTLSLLQWYVAFLCVGAEWFLMWQSKIWNGQEAAMRMFVVMGLSLVFLCQRDEELQPATS